MRIAILATLALSPMMLHAQANSPAKTGMLIAPKAAVTSATDGAKDTSLRISTGVTAPKLISTAEIASVNAFPHITNHTDKVVVSMIVNQDGKPSDLKIVQSAGNAVDQSVLAGVSQYRFKPGTLDNKPTAIPLTLEVTLQHAQ